METIQKYKILICFYILILFFLFLCVSTTPLMIQHGIPLTHDMIIEEEFVETALIVALFGVSFFILKSFMHTLKTYKHVVERTGKEKSRLISRLAEAFNYIGTVNVEMQEIESVLCGVACYPKSKRQFKELADQFATKAMTVAVAPWLIVRVIDRHSAKTIYEHAVHRSDKGPPSATLGNRVILDGQRVHGLQTIGTPQRNLDLLTVFILPENHMTDDRTILFMVILNQIEMHFMLYRVGCLNPVHQPAMTKKEIIHDSNY